MQSLAKVDPPGHLISAKREPRIPSDNEEKGSVGKPLRWRGRETRGAKDEQRERSGEETAKGRERSERVSS